MSANCKASSEDSDEEEAQLRQEAPRGLVGETANGYFFGDVFLPRAWIVDKCRTERMPSWLFFSFYSARAFMVAVPLIALIMAFTVAHFSTACAYASMH